MYLDFKQNMTDEEFKEREIYLSKIKGYYGDLIDYEGLTYLTTRTLKNLYLTIINDLR